MNMKILFAIIIAISFTAAPVDAAIVSLEPDSPFYGIRIALDRLYIITELDSEGKSVKYFEIGEKRLHEMMNAAKENNERAFNIANSENMRLIDGMVNIYSHPESLESVLKIRYALESYNETVLDLEDSLENSGIEYNTTNIYSALDRIDEKVGNSLEREGRKLEEKGYDENEIEDQISEAKTSQTLEAQRGRAAASSIRTSKKFLEEAKEKFSSSKDKAIIDPIITRSEIHLRNAERAQANENHQRALDESRKSLKLSLSVTSGEYIEI